MELSQSLIVMCDPYLTLRGNMDEIRRGMTNNKNLEVTCQLCHA